MRRASFWAVAWGEGRSSFPARPAKMKLSTGVRTQSASLTVGGVTVCSGRNDQCFWGSCVAPFATRPLNRRMAIRVPIFIRRGHRIADPCTVASPAYLAIPHRNTHAWTHAAVELPLNDHGIFVDIRIWNGVGESRRTVLPKMSIGATAVLSSRDVMTLEKDTGI